MNGVIVILQRISYAGILYKCSLINYSQYKFIQFAHDNSIQYGDAVKGLPLSDNSVEVLYSSHMLEHLPKNKVPLFLKEAKRVLCPGGIIRLAVPDLYRLAKWYVDCDISADRFFEISRLPQSDNILKQLIVCPRNHQWMYDNNSLCLLLSDHGFFDAEPMPPNKTKIKDPYPLNLAEKLADSIYVEAVAP